MENDKVLFRVPVFPLPRIVLFPQMVLPLHIFEPRYLELLQDCLAGDRRFAIVQPLTGEPAHAGQESLAARGVGAAPPVHSIGAIGEIVAAQELPDARWNILLQGQERVELVEELTESPSAYRVFHAQQLPDYPLPEENEIDTLTRRLRDIVVQLGSGDETLTEVCDFILVGGRNLELLGHLLCAHLVAHSDERQQLLEERSLIKRSEQLCSLLTQRLLLQLDTGAELEIH